MKQGAKFRRTMKNGFPVTARKTASDFPEFESKEVSTHRSRKGASTHRSKKSTKRERSASKSPTRSNGSYKKSQRDKNLNIDSE